MTYIKAFQTCLKYYLRRFQEYLPKFIEAFLKNASNSLRRRIRKGPDVYVNKTTTKVYLLVFTQQMKISQSTTSRRPHLIFIQTDNCNNLC